MATVQSLTKTRMEAIEDASIVDGEIDGSGHLILTTYGGTDIDAGYMLASVPDASTTVKGIVELATSAETITGTDAVRAVTPAGSSAAISAAITAAATPDASTTVKGKVELATDAETITGTDTVRAITPSNLQAKVASATEKGIVELATDAEATTGTDTVRAVTPANLAAAVTTHVTASSTTVSGKVELATSAEAVTGTDTVRAVTPSGLAAVTSLIGRGVIGSQYTNSSTTVASTAGGETAVPAASWVVEPTYVFLIGRLYKLTIGYGPNNDSATACWMTMRVRKGSASTSGTVLNLTYCHNPAGFAGQGASLGAHAYVKNNTGSNVSTKLSMTIQNMSGVGNARFWTGSVTGGDMLSILIEDIGAIADYTDLANMSIQI